MNSNHVKMAMIASVTLMVNMYLLSSCEKNGQNRAAETKAYWMKLSGHMVTHPDDLKKDEKK